jgi:lysophospholipase L1-like esterase
LNDIRTLQPDALIVLEANLGVTKAKEAKNSQISMERIRSLNEKIKSYTDEKQIFYLDVNPLFEDESGYLRSDVTSDGTHPYAIEYKNWAIWLKEHGIQIAEK